MSGTPVSTGAEPLLLSGLQVAGALIAEQLRALAAAAAGSSPDRPQNDADAASSQAAMSPILRSQASLPGSPIRTRGQPESPGGQIAHAAAKEKSLQESAPSIRHTLQEGPDELIVFKRRSGSSSIPDKGGSPGPNGEGQLQNRLQATTDVVSIAADKLHHDRGLPAKTSKSSRRAKRVLVESNLAVSNGDMSTWPPRGSTSRLTEQAPAVASGWPAHVALLEQGLLATAQRRQYSVAWIDGWSPNVARGDTTFSHSGLPESMAGTSRMRPSDIVVVNSKPAAELRRGLSAVPVPSGHLPAQESGPGWQDSETSLL